MKRVLFMACLTFGLCLAMMGNVKASVLSVSDTAAQQMGTLDQDGDVLNFKKRKRHK